MWAIRIIYKLYSIIELEKGVKKRKIETDLVTGSTPWLDDLSIVPLAINLSLVMTIHQIHQLLLTLRTHEASRMPAQVLVHATRVHCYVTSVDVPVARVTTLKRMTSHVNK